MIKIETYKGQKADFYIQSKGNNAGRPLTTPIPNCFAVHTDVHGAFQIVFALWKAKSFDRVIWGSVIPFMRITECRKIVNRGINQHQLFDDKKLNAVGLIDDKIENLLAQVEKYKQLQYALAMQSLKETGLFEKK